MAEQIGEKTEQPTPRRLEEAVKKGQIARSGEVQTVFVLLGALAALAFAGREIWQQCVSVTALTLGHLYDTSITLDSLQGYGISGVFVLLKCVGPVILATTMAGLVAGGIQNRFNTAPEVLTPNWNRINPVEGFKRLFSARMLVPTAIGLVKFAFILAVTYSQIRHALSDPIFTSPVNAYRLAEFLGETTMRILLRVCLGL
ncbi:MAG TPA: EscU/YscU/HrcU family type III secretion system export apparatus switch protein, partial [Candidatus Saccharimonadales bacterium]|nr:EscU/YscU/HrcU family type III secretion system export apparatus switch protein [Candidatus Saccharimonadales bacterium]